MLFAVAQGQQVESKKCKTCGKLLKECRYKGKHPNKKTTQHGSEEKTIEVEVREDGDNLMVTINGVEFKMIYVQGGTFFMGVANERNGFLCCGKPQHSVTINDYYIGQTEITHALWKAVMGNIPKHWDVGDKLPVARASYDMCKEFISKLNNLTGLIFRLPTEEEWEFAARGGNSSHGYNYSGSNTIGDVAWYYENSDEHTHFVAQKRPNELGLYDMTGNVWEWCEDCWRENYNSTPDCSDHVCRGGGCKSTFDWCHVTTRNDNFRGHNYGNLGFRLVVSK